MSNQNSVPLPSVFKFDFGDFTSLGATFQKFLSSLNAFTNAVYNLLNGGIGFANLQRTIYSQTVTAGSTTPLTFVNPLTIPPSGVTLVQVLQNGKTTTTLTAPVFVGNWFFDGKSINILNLIGLTSGNTYTISLEVF